MNRIKILALTVACALVFASTGHAQEAGKKIAFLDLSKLFDNYQKTKEYDTTLESSHATFKKEHDTKVEKIKDAQSKLDLMKEDEKAKLQKDIDQMIADLNEFDRSKTTDLRKQRDEKVREILLEIEKIVSDFAKTNKYDLILNDRVLIYGNETMDVTEQVLKILNDSYNKK